MTFRVLNPTSEAAIEALALAPRLQTLNGATVGIISNGKEGTKGYFAHLTRLLYDDLGVANVVLRVKSNLSAPADPPIITEAAQWDFAITGIGD